MRLLLLAMLCAAPTFARRPFTPEELLATRRLDDPQVSPDGKQVAFTVRQKSLELNRDVKDVWYRTVLEWIDTHAKKAPGAPRATN